MLALMINIYILGGSVVDHTAIHMKIPVTSVSFLDKNYKAGEHLELKCSSERSRFISSE